MSQPYPPYHTYRSVERVGPVKRSTEPVSRLHANCNENPIYVFLGIARPQSQFKYFQDWSAYLAEAPKTDRSWKYINLSQIYECRNWETEHYLFCFGNKEAAQFHFWEYINRNQTFILDSPWPFICMCLGDPSENKISQNKRALPTEA